MINKNIDWFREMLKVYDFENHPLAAISVSWWESKTDNLPSLSDPLACYLVYRYEIDCCRTGLDLFLSEAQNHCYQLAKILRNHATSPLVQAVRKRLDNSPYQSLLGILPSSPYTDVYMLSQRTSLEVMLQYSHHHSTRIPSHPNAEDSVMDIRWGQVSLIALEPILGPFGSMNQHEVAGVHLEFAGVSYSGT